MSCKLLTLQSLLDVLQIRDLNQQRRAFRVAQQGHTPQTHGEEGQGGRVVVASDVGFVDSHKFSLHFSESEDLGK